MISVNIYCFECNNKMPISFQVRFKLTDSFVIFSPTVAYCFGSLRSMRFPSSIIGQWVHVCIPSLGPVSHPFSVIPVTRNYHNSEGGNIDIESTLSACRMEQERHGIIENTTITLLQNQSLTLQQSAMTERRCR